MILQGFTMEVVYRYISVVPLRVTYKYDETEAIMCSVSRSIKFPADLVTFTEEILNGKLHFLCSVTCYTQ